MPLSDISMEVRFSFNVVLGNWNVKILWKCKMNLYHLIKIDSPAKSRLYLLKLHKQLWLVMIRSIRKALMQFSTIDLFVSDCEWLKCEILNLKEFSYCQAPPAWATNRSIFVQIGHVIHNFYELFKLISTMQLLKWLQGWK